MNEIILTTKSELQEVIKTVILQIDKEKAAKEVPKLFTINQVAKTLGRAHATISKLVAQGLIRTTASGLITEQAINDYLNNE